MNAVKLNPKNALNKAYLKAKTKRDEIEQFKVGLGQLLKNVNNLETEEFHKNLISDFLKKSYYDPRFGINTKGRNDLVIHLGVDSKTPVGVIVEAKKPTNKTEMLKVNNLNTKAFQELLLYYLRERISLNNLEVKHLVATNVYEWFVFEAADFEVLFAQNKVLVKSFEDFELKRLAGAKTDFFYKEIARPAIDAVIGQLRFAHFDIRDYKKYLEKDEGDDAALIALFKIFSPEHLLKLPFVNDSNSLNKEFYTELLHIIGLSETRDNGKKVIGRKANGERNSGSLIENSITQIQSLDKISRLPKPTVFGATRSEQLFNVAMDLVITWINRILFLKLLEAQLMTYNRDDVSFAFLNIKRIKNFDELNSLFFQVLACRVSDRSEDIAVAFAKVPYLNSTLFEPTELEHTTLFISNLSHEKKIDLHPSTVLKGKNGKRKTGDLPALEYLFEFLDAYDFASSGAEAIQEQSKSLINASVLGLIFEKINGYRDGSYFTPGFVTMYMCRETIRTAVLQKFNAVKGWTCATIEDLYNKIEDRSEANAIINGITICDPAVGSGHFLVSALNELIAIKSDLKILTTRDGKRLKEYNVEIVNDELVLTDEDGDLFEYKPKNGESQKIQEALFHEKQTLIENCLFGVDINPNSVKICRLRLWIELLKSSYYKKNNELETLPNIDINIKCGNSLVSRFDLRSDLTQVLKKSKGALQKYKAAVRGYREAKSKEQKREFEAVITEIKEEFRSEIQSNDPRIRSHRKAVEELKTLMGQQLLFEESRKEKSLRKKKQTALEAEVKRRAEEIQAIIDNKIFENAFEWRFEFAEVLDESGEFLGFDVCIGNPPWGAAMSPAVLQHVKSRNEDIIVRMVDSFMFFINLCLGLKAEGGCVAQIVPDVLLYQIDNRRVREKVLSEFQLLIAGNLGDNIFEDVARACCIVVIGDVVRGDTTVFEYRKNDGPALTESRKTYVPQQFFQNLPNKIFATRNLERYALLARLGECKLFELVDGDGIQRGISPDLKDAFIVDEPTIVQQKLEESFIYPTITGGRDVNRYSASDIGKRIIYTRGDMDPAEFPNIVKRIRSFESRITCKEVSENKHPIWSLHRARDKRIFQKAEKIVGVITGDTVSVSLDESNLFPTDGLYIFSSNGIYSNMFLVGLLNSKLITFLYRLISLEEGRALAQIKPNILSDLPIRKDFDPILVEKVEDLTRDIIGKIANDNDFTAAIRDLDQLAYLLYGLSEDERGLVESS